MLKKLDTMHNITYLLLAKQPLLNVLPRNLVFIRSLLPLLYVLHTISKLV